MCFLSFINKENAKHLIIVIVAIEIKVTSSILWAFSEKSLQAWNFDIKQAMNNLT